MTTSSASPTSAEAPDTLVGQLRGAGPVTAARLAEAGIATARDLLLRLPRAYDDLRRETPLAELGGVPDGQVALVRGTVKRVHVFPRRFLDVVLETPGAAGATLRGRWFRAHASMAKSFPKGAEVALAGALRTAGDGTREMLHPSHVTAALAERAAGAGAGAGLGIRPRYAAIEGVGARIAERLMASALARAAEVPDLLPAEARARLGLPPLAEALRAVHAPPDDLDEAALAALRDGVSAVHRRLALEELLVVQVAFLLRRAAAGAGGAPAPVPVEPDQAAALGRVEAALGFRFTAAQARAVGDIARDLGGRGARPGPMQRLLVGDVGSGKTAVAFAAAARVAAHGGQTLMMAPTEVLAEQHARSLAPAAARLGMELGLLTAATVRRDRERLSARFAAGELAVLIGTHALLDPDLRAADLRLAVVDEQHRFGVAQRARLGRGEAAGAGAGVGAGRPASPHLLVMSATPIPRTLALALHGDLDASVLDERPAGRAAPAAEVAVGEDARQGAYLRLRAAVAAGRQGFVVCPIRERSKRAGAVTAVARYATLRRELAPARVGLVHGALAAADKEAVLRAFAAGEIDVLVATTVVELGIDVPNATVMIVEEAERFGLAQLHQLRGRVGRGAYAGVCILCAATAADDEGEGASESAGEGDGAASSARARLDDVAATSDGFRLAELDLERRGFGDLFGTRQAGEAGGLGRGARGLRELFALVEIARREADALLARDPELRDPAHAALARAALARALGVAGQPSLHGEEAG